MTESRTEKSQGSPAKPAFTPPAGRFKFEPVALNFDKMGGLVPFVLQHAYTGQVLMVGFLNREAWEVSCKTGILTMYRRTLRRLWAMGEEDGHFVEFTRVIVDCDDDTVLFETVPERHICGHGFLSCFCREIPAAH
jgi:phosphoribosyl-ATP pyrophosphohydrolase/phosphoribosyl-AMP cyclohydrolase